MTPTFLVSPPPPRMTLSEPEVPPASLGFSLPKVTPRQREGASPGVQVTVSSQQVFSELFVESIIFVSGERTSWKQVLPSAQRQEGFRSPSSCSNH